MAESAVQRFSSVIPSIHDRDYIVVQTMIFASFIHLQRSAHFDSRAFNAAKSMVRLIEQLGEIDFPCLDPIISVRFSFSNTVISGVF